MPSLNVSHSHIVKLRNDEKPNIWVWLGFAKLSPSFMAKLSLKAGLALISINPTTHIQPGKLLVWHRLSCLAQLGLAELGTSQPQLFQPYS